MHSHDGLAARMVDGLREALDEHGLREPVLVVAFSVEGYGIVARYGPAGRFEILSSTMPDEPHVWRHPITLLCLDGHGNATRRTLSDPPASFAAVN